MNCNECIKANTINRCANTIFIPDVSGTSGGDFSVTIEDTATGRVFLVDVTATLNTLLIPVDDIEFMDGHTYEVRVYEDGDFNELREITIGVTSGCCVTFQTQDRGVTGTYEILSLDGCN